MAITTLDGVIAGMQPPQYISKVGVTMEAIGVPHSHFYSTGAPGAAAAPTPGAGGAALTTYAGQIPFNNPGSGNTYLARFSMNASVGCTLLLCDRLWHNSGLSTTLTTSQTVNSVTLPARDLTGTTNGEAILCGIEWSAAGGAGTPTETLTYTNQAGTGSRTITLTGNATPAAGTIEIFGLQAGDTGIRSIQSFQHSATRTSGTFHLVLFRVLAAIGCPAAYIPGTVDALTGGFPRLYDNTVPFIIQIPTATTATNILGQVVYSQG